MCTYTKTKKKEAMLVWVYLINQPDSAKCLEYLKILSLFIILFLKSMNADDDDEPCRLVCRPCPWLPRLWARGII